MKGVPMKFCPFFIHFSVVIFCVVLREQAEEPNLQVAKETVPLLEKALVRLQAFIVAKQAEM